AHGGEVEGVKYDSLDRFLLYTSPVEIRCTLLGLMGLICVLLGHITGHWEPKFLLFAWGFKYLFSASNTNKVINAIKCSFLDFLLIFYFSLLKYTYHYNYRSHISLQVAGVQILIFPTVYHSPSHIKTNS